jgi:hypothetical protein
MITREQLDWLSENFPPNARLSSIKTKCLTRIVAAELQNAMAIERMERDLWKVNAEHMKDALAYAFDDMLHHGAGVVHFGVDFGGKDATVRHVTIEEWRGQTDAE